MRQLNRYIITLLLLFLSVSQTKAAKLEDFAPEKICVAGTVDKKQFMQAALDQKKCDGCTSPESILRASKKWEVQSFLKFINQHYPGKFRVKSAPLTPDGYIDYEELVRTVEQHVVCLDATPTIRTKLNDASKRVSQAVIVRKDVDNLEVADLSSAKPASFSYSQDWRADNTVKSYEVAVGHKLEGALRPGQQMDLPYSLMPYARFLGQFNSNPKKPDVDIAALGLRGDVYGIPLLGLEHHFAVRGEYITDQSAASSIALGELLWEPLPPFDPAFPHPFGHPQFYFGPQGPYIRLDLTGRFRFGQVFDPGIAPTILTKESYMRVGGKGGVTLGFGGNDILSGLSFYATYLYFHTLDGQGGTFDKFEAGANYQITDNYGITIKYVDGTDEDKLELIKKLEAGFTIKF